MGDVTENFACAPILLIGFNRPDFMAQQIEVLKRIRPPKVYVAVDGPRDNVDGESRLCNDVRDCVRLIDWECDVKTLFREKNRGCKYGVSEAISWFFENEPEGIILEDDCRPDLSFFRFATELLERYRDDERIGAISGFDTYGYQTDKSVSYRFSAHWGVWGCASWRRVWKHYDVDLSGGADSCNVVRLNLHSHPDRVRFQDIGKPVSIDGRLYCRVFSPCRTFFMPFRTMRYYEKSLRLYDGWEKEFVGCVWEKKICLAPHGWTLAEHLHRSDSSPVNKLIKDGRVGAMEKR